MPPVIPLFYHEPEHNIGYLIFRLLENPYGRGSQLGRRADASFGKSKGVTSLHP